jgi:16S rRNA (guanine(966)-N(2))-methyltransferase RsmD
LKEKAELRVIAGIAKKCKLIAPAGLAVRPTSDRVKEAMFNILGAFVAECNFLDLFAGSGGVGIEALSRGAAKAVFVEKELINMRVIKKNLQHTGLAAGARCICADAAKAMRLLSAEKAVFDVAFIDPPYARGAALDALARLTECGLLAPGGLAIVESGRETLVLEDLPNKVKAYRQEKYGNTVLTFFCHQ